MALLSSEEQRIAGIESSESVSIRIEGSTVITEGFTGEIALGDGYGEEFLSRLEADLTAIYPTNKQEIELFIGELAEDYAQGRQKQAQPNTREEPKKRKNWIVLLVVFGLLSCVGVAFFFVIRPYVDKREPPQTTQLSETNDESQLKQAVKGMSAEELGKKYPKQLSTLANLLAESEQFDKLETFQKTYPTDEGAFNLAFYKKEWEKVIQVPSTNLSKEKRVMLAHAYVELGKLSEAEIINESLKSETIQTEVTAAYKRKAILLIQQGELAKAEEIQKKINDKELPELIETGKTCQEMIAYYKKEKDVDNQNLWLKRLESLGGELLSNEKNE